MTMRIVVVDDDPDIRFLLRRPLEPRHEVVEFENVAQARASGVWPKTDVAIIDVMLPVESGDVLLNWLAAEHSHVRTVICTAKGFADLDLSKFGAAHDIIGKPFKEDDVLAAVNDG